MLFYSKPYIYFETVNLKLSYWFMLFHCLEYLFYRNYRVYQRVQSNTDDFIPSIKAMLIFYIAYCIVVILWNHHGCCFMHTGIMVKPPTLSPTAGISSV